MAALARLSLTDDEAERFSGQLDAVLGYLQQLSEVDVTGVKENSPRPGGEALRADEVGLRLDRETALSQAAEVRDGHVAVPKILSDSGEGR